MPNPPANVDVGDILGVATPNEHTNYSVVFLNEQNNRLHAFGSGIDALEGEKSNRIAAYDAETANRKAEFEAAQAAADKAHTAALAGINSRIADLALGADMARAAVAIYEEHQPKTETSS